MKAARTRSRPTSRPRSISSRANPSIHDEVDGVGLRVVLYDALHQTGKLVTGTIRCRGGEVATGLWFHGAEYVGRATPFILIVLLGRFPWFGRDRWAHVRVQRHRLLIYANDGFGRIVGRFIDGQHVLH